MTNFAGKHQAPLEEARRRVVVLRLPSQEE